MQCGICERETSQLSCVSCARSSAWKPRYEILLRITERDSASEKVQEYLEGRGGERDVARIQRDEIRERIRGMREQTERLRSSVQSDMAKISALRQENEKRRQRLDETIIIKERREQAAENVQRDIRRLNQKWKTLYARTAEARSFLCREAAMLYGLRQKRRKSGRTDYIIGGVALPNLLQDLNGHHYTQITTSLSHLSHLLVLISHYLGLKLPNEILLPTRITPHTTIRGPLSNRHLGSRPLYLSSPLAVLSRENSSAHTKFVEGVSMLAINIAWLCFSQGLEITTIEDTCKPGWNMWRLLVPKDSTAATSPAFGRLSHATSFGNISTAGGATMRKFAIGLNVVVEKIRYTLQGETIVADWDLVPEAEREARVVRMGFESGITDETDANSKESESESGSGKEMSRGSPTSGTNGWMRIRARAAAGKK